MEAETEQCKANVLSMLTDTDAGIYSAHYHRIVTVLHALVDLGQVQSGTVD